MRAMAGRSPAAGILAPMVVVGLLSLGFGRRPTTILAEKHANLATFGERQKAQRLDGVKPIAFVFAADCAGEYQMIQAAIMEWSWQETGTEGTLTRIATGCETPQQESEARRSVLSGDPRYEVFLTEGDLRVVPETGRLWPYRARPWAVMQWLEKDLPPWNRARAPERVVITDPDFMWLRPLTSHPQFANVKRGHMLAARYDVGNGWIDLFPDFLGEPAPEDMVLDHFAPDRGYGSGPPWLLDIQDFRDITPLWSNYTDTLAGKDGRFLDEMWAFLLAAVKLRIPMLPDGDTILVSSPLAHQEAWTNEQDPAKWKPYLMHYCQSHQYKDWYFHKSLVARDGCFFQKFDNAIPGIISCGASDLLEPPAPPDSEAEPDRKGRMEAWFIHQLIRGLNNGSRAFRAKHCLPTQGRSDLLVRTIAPVECKGEQEQTRETSMYYVPVGDGPQAKTWDGLGVGSDQRETICEHQH